MREWISVEDKKPEKNEKVLVWHKQLEKVYFDRWLGEYWYDSALSQISHWMPLPEPPHS